MKGLKMILFGTLALVVAVSAAACGKADDKKIVVGASATPHAEILAQITEDLAAKGYTLEIKEFSDYVQPNLALEDKSLDANYFQHLPYLEDFNAENKTKIVSAGAVHYEPFGLYPGKIATLDELKAAKGAVIAVPNDTTNEARALLLLEANGLISINPEAGLKATINDITDNPNNIQIKELEAAQLARSLPDVDAAVINGNYALEANLKVDANSIATEAKGSLAAETFGNIVAVREGEEGSAKTKALMEALKSDKVKDFIESTYEGSVVPTF